MFRQRVAPLVDVACKPKYVFLQRAKRPRYEFSATVLHKTCK